mmetsp:Transcript_1003/g.1384  ORF Transcript_1003/g.1384 Transcript_1003/m.1384 type:complete len:204 (-) Transcript_1003:931-1542(-)
MRSCSLAMKSRAFETVTSLFVRSSTVSASSFFSLCNFSLDIMYVEEDSEFCAALSASLPARSDTWEASVCSVCILFLSCTSSIALLALSSSISISRILVVSSYFFLSASVICFSFWLTSSKIRALLLISVWSFSIVSNVALIDSFSSRSWSFSAANCFSCCSLAAVMSRRLASRFAILVARNRSVSDRVDSCASRLFTWSTST